MVSVTVRILSVALTQPLHGSLLVPQQSDLPTYRNARSNSSSKSKFKRGSNGRSEKAASAGSMGVPRTAGAGEAGPLVFSEAVGLAWTLAELQVGMKGVKRRGGPVGINITGRMGDPLPL